MAVLRKLILFLLLLVFLGGVYRLLNEEPPRAGSASALAAAKAWPPGIDQLLPDQEFSCLAVLDASLKGQPFMLAAIMAFSRSTLRPWLPGQSSMLARHSSLSGPCRSSMASSGSAMSRA